MTATLYLVRHGVTLFNTKHIIQGWTDSPLTPEGEEQAARVGRFFRHEGISFDHAYASTLSRTHQTIERITDMPYGSEPGLREWYFGMYEGEHTYLMPEYPWGDFFVQYGGERQSEMEARVCGALVGIMQRPGHERVLAVSHGSACRQVLAKWDGYTGEKVPGNCSVMQLAFDGDAGFDACFRVERTIEQDDMKRVLGE